MITLSPFLKTREPKGVSPEWRSGALNRVVSVLLRGIARHSCHWDEAQAVRLDHAIRGARADFECAEDETSAILAAGAAVHLLEEHTAATTHAWLERRRELERVNALLIETLLTVSQAQPAMVRRVKAAETALNAAPGSAEAAVVRAELADCMSELLFAHRAAADFARNPSGLETRTDTVTGLPDSNSAVAAMRGVWNRRQSLYAAVLTLERLETINFRFGVRAGDQMLQMLSERIARGLGEEDRLFRWRGPCLMILMRREAPEAHVATEVSRIAAARAEAALTIRDRDVLAPISVSWRLFALYRHDSPDDLVREIGTVAVNRARGPRRVLAAAV